MTLKKIFKPLKKVIKELKWRKYKLNLMIKRLEKKKIEPLIDLNEYLRNGLKSIEGAINEFEGGLNILRNFVAQHGIEIQPNYKSKLRTQEDDVYDVLLCGIRLNLKPESLTTIIQCCLLKKRILILLDNHLAYLKDVILQFLDYIFADSFNKEMKVLTKEEYLKKKILYEDYIIVENGNPNGNGLSETKLIDLKFVEKLIEDYYHETDVSIGRGSLRYKLQELFSLSKALIDFYQKRRNVLVPKVAIKHLEEVFFIKIKKDYLNFLIAIIQNYFNMNIKYAKDYVADQITQLMRF